MRKLVLVFVFFTLCYLCNAQAKKYKAIITAMNIDYDGYVHVNLTGENKGLIRIDVIKKFSTDTSFLSKLLGYRIRIIQHSK